MTHTIELRAPDLPADPTHVVERLASRAVVVDDIGRLLLLRSRHGDLKFPGGGVEPGESLPEAMVREVAEECGLLDARPGPALLQVVELRSAHEIGAVFRMTSVYLQTALDPGSPDVGSVAGQRVLKDYEQDLDLTPCWIDRRTALRSNADLLDTWDVETLHRTAPWLQRETHVLLALSGRLPDRRD